MSSEVKLFLDLLFDEGQTTCFSESANGYKVSHAPKESDLFFCINALHPYTDSAPTQEWHDKNRPRRADVNVVCFRNFLIEIDKIALNEQVKYVFDRLPLISSIVYSGGKSNHFIISLETPLENAQEYRAFSYRLHKLLDSADPATKNPSRLSRLPGRLRPDTGKQQKLHYINSRIKKEDLEKYLPEAMGSASYSVPQTDSDKRTFYTPIILQAVYDPDRTILEKNLGGRNAFFFWLHMRMKDLNLDAAKQSHFISTAYSNLKNKDGFSMQEAYAAARLNFHN